MNELVPEGWCFHKVGELIKESRQPIADDDPAKRLTIRLRLKGVERRQERATDRIGSTTYFERRKGQFIYGKQNLHKGALGIIPNEYDGFSSSQDIPTFDFNKFCEPQWFTQFFMQPHFHAGLERIASGTGSKRIQPRDLFVVDIPFPPLPEQKKIASILTSVDEVIENTQKQIDKLQDLKKATMNDLLTKGIGHTEFKDSELGRVPEGWLKIKLGEVGAFSTSSVNKKSVKNEQDVSLLNYMDVYNYSTLTEKFPFQKVTAPNKQISSSSVKDGDMFFTPSSETPDDIGHSAIFIGEGSGIVHSYHTIRFRPFTDEYLDNNFKAHAFGSAKTYGYFRKRATGSTRFTLSLPVFNELEITIPPLPEQKKIASILTSVDEVIAEKRRKLNQTQSLKKSLMQDLLTGKVRVKV